MGRWGQLHARAEVGRQAGVSSIDTGGRQGRAVLVQIGWSSCHLQRGGMMLQPPDPCRSVSPDLGGGVGR